MNQLKYSLYQVEADDPLDAFMAEMQQLVDEQEAQPAKAGRAELEEEEDNVADFLEASIASIHSHDII